MLVIVLILQLLLLFWHMDVFSSFFISKSKSRLDQPAGLIAKSENRLHRRPANSLIWEKSQIREPIYYYDSLLTLEKSTATLELFAKTEIKLSENTLVTVEPPEDVRSGEIRLRFNRGGLRTRNPFATTKIATSDFIVDVASGSDLELRKLNDGNFEIQLSAGKANVKSSEGTRALSPNEFFRIQKGKMSSVKVDSSLEWKNRPPARVYSHKVPITVDVEWKGRAQSLIVQTTGRGERTIPLGEGESRQSVVLESGHHTVFLKSETGSEMRWSQPLSIEVWKAPVVHLVMPLPRDRIKTNSKHNFYWARLPEATSYILKADGKDSHIAQKTSLTTLEMSFAHDEDIQWSVWAKDKEGFLIPPLYTYPLYIRTEPFAPPRLHTPRFHKPLLRAPAQSPKSNTGASLWNIIIPQAHAEDGEHISATLTWDEVPGADRYWIEISDSPDFRNPVISKYISKTEFTVKNLPVRTYYWRVAAGHSGGRMGIFSAVATLQDAPTYLVESAKPSEEKPKQIDEKPQASAVVPEPTPQAAIKSKDSTVKSRADEATAITPNDGARVYWRGGYGLIDVKAETSIAAQLEGIKPLALGIEADVFRTSMSWWRLALAVSQTEFTPDPEPLYPYQKSLSVLQGQVSATYLQSNSVCNYGLSAFVVPAFTRVGAEAIENKSEWAFGPHVQALIKSSSREYQMKLAALVGAGGYGAQMSHRFLGKPFGESLLLGVEIEALLLLDSPNRTVTGDASLILGFEF